MQMKFKQERKNYILPQLYICNVDLKGKVFKLIVTIWFIGQCIWTL